MQSLSYCARTWSLEDTNWACCARSAQQILVPPPLITNAGRAHHFDLSCRPNATRSPFDDSRPVAIWGPLVVRLNEWRMAAGYRLAIAVGQLAAADCDSLSSKVAADASERASADSVAAAAVGAGDGDGDRHLPKALGRSTTTKPVDIVEDAAEHLDIGWSGDRAENYTAVALEAHNFPRQNYSFRANVFDVAWHRVVAPGDMTIDSRHVADAADAVDVVVAT